jgi:hypothetical protein
VNVDHARREPMDDDGEFAATNDERPGHIAVAGPFAYWV